MRLSAVLAALLPAGGAFAATFQVVVGNNSELTFSPPSISSAASGDTIQFIFATKNHTATQSTFADPCTAFTTPGQPPIDSGFMFVQPGTTTNFPTYNVQLTNVTAPLWFYCRQTGHCEMGMVFAVNPTAEKSFAAFQAAAQGAPNAAPNATSATNSSSIASAPASTAVSPSGLAVSSTSTSLSTSDTSAPSSTDASSTPTDSSSSAAPSSTDSSSNTTSPTSSSAADTPTGSSPASALRVGSTGVLLGGIGLLALAL